MTAAKKISIPFEDKVRIPNKSKYLIDIWGNVFNHVMSFNETEYLRNVTVYLDFHGLKYCYLGPTKKRKDRFYIMDLLELCYPTGNLSVIKARKEAEESVIIINRPSGESRVKLNRERVINLLLTFYKDQVQIPLTRNGKGVYETSEDMKGLGIIICDSCGHPQPDHSKSCSECNEWLLKSNRACR